MTAPACREQNPRSKRPPPEEPTLSKVTITPLDPTSPAEPHRMISPAEAARLRADLTTTIAEALSALPVFAGSGLEGSVAVVLDDFFALYPKRPVADNKGGSGLNDSLWLYLLARLFEPALIVESGSHKGHSAWLFRQACPDAEIHSFDIDHSRLAHRASGVIFHEEDWAPARFPEADPERSLVFLDDHISHARRLREAGAKGFRHLLLDDNFSAETLHATGGPPLPTLAMLLDPDLAFGRELAWTRNQKTYRYLYDEDEAAGAADLVAAHRVLPELAPITRHPSGSCLTYARLKG